MEDIKKTIFSAFVIGRVIFSNKAEEYSFYQLPKFRSSVMPLINIYQIYERNSKQLMIEFLNICERSRYFSSNVRQKIFTKIIFTSQV